MKNCSIILLFFFISLQLAAVEYANPVSRDPMKWPFAQNSIWNTPIGSNAKYVDAQIEWASNASTVDEEYIIMTPTAPLMDVYYSSAGWDQNKSRCTKTGGLLLSLPIPQSFIVSPSTWDGSTPNAGAAVLMPDGHTIKQNQPFAHCTEGGYATSMFKFNDLDIYTDGMYGAHGGSGLSSIGGSLRIQELTPTSGPICHALKINLWGAKNLYYDDLTKGYRWPAQRADSYAGSGSNAYGSQRTLPVVKECRMGALLAIPSTLDLATLGLLTEPGLLLAQCFQDYGGYVVDDTAWDAYGISVEWSPDGRFTDEFVKNWGFNFSTNSLSSFGKDMIKIYSKLSVVDNNTARNVGGGGINRAPMAPPFGTIAGIEQVEGTELKVYPSPSNDFINVKGGSGILKIENLLGMTLISKFNIQDESINISSLIPGIYFLKTGNKSVKFLKK
jgi:hypothetical protein